MDPSNPQETTVEGQTTNTASTATTTTAATETRVNEPILIQVRNQAGETKQFRIRKETELRKIFENYATLVGLQVEAITFRLDGERINGTQTPASLNMENDDIIEALVEQLGGTL